VSLQPSTAGVIPFNFFAGLTPTVATDLAWAEGYSYVITSIFLTTGATDGPTTVTVTDAEENYRWQGEVEAGSSTLPQRINDQLWIVLGPNSGAKIVSTTSEAIVTIDGFALLPGQLPIW
jgi:hypothetical protein